MRTLARTMALVIGLAATAWAGDGPKPAAGKRAPSTVPKAAAKPGAQASAAPQGEREKQLARVAAMRRAKAQAKVDRRREMQRRQRAAAKARGEGYLYALGQRNARDQARGRRVEVP